ncbi:hypothetical protein [Lysinibacillus sp. C5.1]|uniref:hypothetical protein n=1 Tax=Lysinibacillus sp. C5.1 TaxID=2796169 RepID=UPI00308157FD
MKKNLSDVNKEDVYEKERSLPWWMYVIIVILILITPGILAVFMDFEIFASARGGIDGWLSYWGAYLGGIIGLIAIVGTTQFLISTQKNLHKQQLFQQNLHQNKLIEDQQKHHQEQLDQQKEHHIKMIEEQKQQHQAQLESQRKAIEDSAKLQDKTERERYILQLELRKTEEFSKLLIDIEDHLQKLKLIAFKSMDMLKNVAERYGSYTLASLKEDVEGKNEHEDGFKNNIANLNSIFTNYTNLTLDIDKIINNLLIYNIAEDLEMLDFRNELRDGIDIVSLNLKGEQKRFEDIKNNKNLESKLGIVDIINDCESIIVKNDKSIDNIVKKVNEKKYQLLVLQDKLLDEFRPKESDIK